MVSMVLMAACGVLVLVGLLSVVFWGGLDVRPASEVPADGPPPAGLVLRGYVRGITLAIVGGIGAGFLVAGCGGRLAMRLLAATAGPEAQGRLTEAEETVGAITTGGTIGFIVFTGLFFGLATGVLFMLLRRWLPSGRLGGLTFGALLLVAAAPHVDPLRPENPDFDIVGPGWVAVVVFSAMALLHGMVVAAIAGRYSRVCPLIAPTPRGLITHAPLLVLGPGLLVIVPLAVGGVVAWLMTRYRSVVKAWRSGAVAPVGRVFLAAGSLVALPWFVSAAVDIVGRGP